MIPEPIQRFIELFSKLPSLGPRQATRLAFLIAGKGKAEIRELAAALASLGALTSCAECFARYTPHTSHAAQNLCSICNTSDRAQNVVAIIERDTDRIAMEGTKKFRGRYLVIGEIGRAGILSPDQKMRIQHLKNSLVKRFGKAEEIILALNPSSIGDLQAESIAKELTGSASRVTRLGRGLPSGGEIEFADEDTLGGAIENRR